MTILEVLLVGHVIGDWLLQTEWQAVNKARSWRALAAHVLTYHAVLLVLIGLKMGFDRGAIYAAVGVLALLHTVLDRQAFVRWFMRTFRITVDRAPERWLSVAVDQSLHIVILAGAAVYLSHF